VAVASSHEQRRAAAQLRTEGAAWADIAAVLRVRYGLNGLTAARQAHGWTQQRAADEWRRRWPGAPIEQKTISGWETWETTGRTPSLRVLNRLAELYTVAASDLLAGWADFRPEDVSGTSIHGYPAPVDRRSFLGVAAGAGVMAALPAVGTKIGAADVERLRDLYWQLWHADEAQGGATVYAATTALLAHVQELRERSRYGSTVGRDLLVLVGQLEDHAAFTAYDAGRHDQARAHFHAALTAARVADDQALEVYVMAEMANMASWLGQGRETVELAQAAERIGRGPARLSAVLAAREAEGHALRGDAVQAQAALSRSERELADAGHDDGAWYAYFGEPNLQFMAATAFESLDTPVAAERCARASVASTLAPRPRARAVARHARSLVACGRLDEAAAVTVQAVELGHGVSSHRMRADLADLRPAFAAHESVPGVPEALHALTEVR
jgi:transcriptional regulator with XRE-family HTH domain